MQNNSGKLSRGGFDIIVLALAAVGAGGAAAYHFWPVSCSNLQILVPAEDIVRRELNADRVTFHLIEKASRNPHELSCVATARVEFKARNSEYHDVAYRAQMDGARHVLGVTAAVKPPQD